MNACPICGRSPRGFGYQRPHDQYAPRFKACSMQCLNIISKWKGKMEIKLDKFEEEGIDAASEEAGRYLEGLGKFDIALLSASEWRKLLATVFVAATARIREIRSDDIPF